MLQMDLRWRTAIILQIMEKSPYLGNGSTDSPIVTKFGTVTQNDPTYRIRIGR